LQNHSDALYEFLLVIVLVLVGMTIVWYLIIFENPQVVLNPFKPPLATPITLAGVLPRTEVPGISDLSPLPTETQDPPPTPLPVPSASITAVSPSPSLAPPPTLSSQTPTAATTLGYNFMQPNPPSGDKWIDVNISDQTITAYVGSTPLKTALVSTGVASHPTVIGQYKIYVKIRSQAMSGGSRFSHDYYYLPGVPNIMFFYNGYAIHGTYWHNNFGHPMSHGCVNLSLEDARWFFNWAEVGTTVVTHR
jgi:lipoprotein-anchoring transpeptidase ErfK/SrfK